MCVLQAEGGVTAQEYLKAALEHMRSNGIKFHFTPQGR